ncbi:TorF family putative porin [Noviherbaspirillum sp. CPCC 100848]|uniref:TorF family putative porin n=1 Tax=Noviherbaspirillum album TaxID=3080276 RepID=A0ABU6JHE0_9BURK|nr:TorF family putative porin [Noviherbaspirillum sp. CPCC 100848]MEC4722710.1 TorF family putative porin [Noviherbaspirillum sp. CPCC 100848]
MKYSIKRYSLAIITLMSGCIWHAHGAAAADLDSNEKSVWTTTGNVSLVSDYVFRGVSQTQRKPTIQAGVDISHANGLYLGVWGSGVSSAAYSNTSGGEIDIYGGYRFPLTENANIDLGVITCWFPGASYSAFGRSVKYNTQEAKVGVTMGNISVAAYVALNNDWFGLAVDPFTGMERDTRGSRYIEANWNPEIGDGYTINLHVGRQHVRHLDMYDFTDFKVGLTKAIGQWNVSIAGTYNNGRADSNGVPLWTYFNADGSSKNVVGKAFILSATRSF